MESGIPDEYQGLDIGPETIKAFCAEIKKARTVLWNGPLGVYEFRLFTLGTDAIAHCLKEIKGTTIVGGGDSIAALQKLNLVNDVTHISTGGGATLEFIKLGTLPGIEALSPKKEVLKAL